MDHGQRYRLVLRNSNNERCDARVEVDGNHVGTWRILGHRSITLERPAEDDGHFTFYKLGSPEGAQIQLVDNANLGLVKVTFTPEVRPRPLPRTRGSSSASYAMPAAAAPMQWDETSSAPASYGISKSASLGMADSGAESYSAGGTGLSGHSSQTFGVAQPINLDYSRQTVIHLRLVCKDEDQPRPLTSHSTPVPPRVS